jgi:hypothetical protein
MSVHRVAALALLIILCGCSEAKRVTPVHQVRRGQGAKRVRRAYKDRLARLGRQDRRARQDRQVQQFESSAPIV